MFLSILLSSELLLKKKPVKLYLQNSMVFASQSFKFSHIAPMEELESLWDTWYDWSQQQPQFSVPISVLVSFLLLWQITPKKNLREKSIFV